MKPKAYDPEHGYRYQIFCRDLSISRTWEHCDYATDIDDRQHLLTEYCIAYGPSWQFKTVLLPAKFWPSRDASTHQRIT